MASKAEQTARLRIKSAGNMPPNGMKVGSDLHLCELLLSEMDGLRKANAELLEISAGLRLGCCNPASLNYSDLRKWIARLDAAIELAEKQGSE